MSACSESHLTSRPEERVRSGEADTKFGDYQTDAIITPDSLISYSVKRQEEPMPDELEPSSSLPKDMLTPQNWDEKQNINSRTNKRKKKPQRASRTTCAKRERHFVEHHYHDHSFDRIEDYVPEGLMVNCDTSLHDSDSNNNGGPDESLGSIMQRFGKVKKRGGVAIPFPMKLHDLLENAGKNGLSDIISWCPHGRCFVVHNSREFVQSVMPKWFRQTKLTSFQRQLNLYGFCRLTRGRDSGAYYHELFLRGRPFLCRGMLRTKVKGTGYKASSSPSSEPDFYSMPPVYPTTTEYLCPDPHKETLGDDRDRHMESTDPQTPRPQRITIRGNASVARKSIPITPVPSKECHVTPENSPVAHTNNGVNRFSVPQLSPSDKGKIPSIVSIKSQKRPCGIPSLGQRGKVIRVGNQSFQYLEHFDSVPPLPVPIQGSDLNCDGDDSMETKPPISKTFHHSFPESPKQREGCKESLSLDQHVTGTNESVQSQNPVVQQHSSEEDLESIDGNDGALFPVKEQLDEFLNIIGTDCEDDVNLGYALDSFLEEAISESVQV